MCRARKDALVICSGAASRRDCRMGFNSVLWGFNSVARSSGPVYRAAAAVRDWRAAAGGCHCASLMMKRRAAAAAVRPFVWPGPGSLPSSFPQVTCLGRSGGSVLLTLFACEMRAPPALAVLAWSGDGSPVRGCTTTSGDRVPRTRQIPMSSRSRACSVVTRVQPPAAAGSVPRFLPRRSSFHRPDAGGLRR
jgi:hypothetical protein